MLDRVFEFDTFEQEVAPALMRWDMDAARRVGEIPPLSEMNDWDRLITNLFLELDARRKRARSSIPADPIQSPNDHSRSAEEGISEKDQTLIFDDLQNVGPASHPQQIDADEIRETSSGSSRDDDWESVLET